MSRPCINCFGNGMAWDRRRNGMRTCTDCGGTGEYPSGLLRGIVHGCTYTFALVCLVMLVWLLTK